MFILAVNVFYKNYNSSEMTSAQTECKLNLILD